MRNPNEYEGSGEENFVDKITKTSVFLFIGLLFLGIVLFPIVFSLVKTDVIQKENLPFANYDSTPDALVDMIREKQMAYVKESSSPDKSLCFTERDLNNFKDNNVLGEIVNKLKDNKRFLSIIEKSRELSQPELDTLIVQARQVRRPTWEELGKVSSDGQTEAGSEAELMISKAVVDLFLALRGN